jgi:leucyl-tRNA synthetase
MTYDHKQIEKKWQNYWEENQTYKADMYSDKEKYYALDMFPYPSGAGLHVGHPEGFTATDIMSRYKRMNGFEVLHPMGFDAFGLPAEQFALKTNNDPADFTNLNIDTFTKQIKSLGFSYDWSKELRTTDPNYYKITQWIFIQLHKQGLAELKEIQVNWCQELGTVLANEEILIENGKMVSERGSFPVVKRNMKQWVLKITHFAERLLDDLDGLDWPEAIKEQQRNWIGKSSGAVVDFKLEGTEQVIQTYTTRPDTLYGVSHLVISPENELVTMITTEENKKQVEEYCELAKTKTDLERSELNKDKTGVLTGAYVINPVNNQKVPVYVGDYVLNSYGTGAIMAVPAHDERDNEFAKKYNIGFINVIDGQSDENGVIVNGVAVNSELINGLSSAQAKEKMIEFLEKNQVGNRKINYRLRDWIFSRQRYWGEPFPIIHYENGVVELVEDLPVLLPKVKEYKPNPNGEPPLELATEWVNVVSPIHGKGRRETNVMPQWAGSCWYYIGYIINDNGNFASLDDPKTQELLAKWLPVDLYIGGAEHAVLHLLYARFWHKVLYDIGVVKTKEPFQKLVNQGMILGENGEKMSKSLGNVVNPDDIVEEFGADTLRIYEMFMGPLEASIAWSKNGLYASRKWLERVWRALTELEVTPTNVSQLDTSLNIMVKKVTDYLEAGKYNTAISEMMIFINAVYKEQKIGKEQATDFLKVLFVFAPHIAEELATKINSNETTLSYANWPKVDESLVKSQKIELLVQVNSRKKAVLEVEQDLSQAEAVMLACQKLELNESDFKKVIYKSNIMINIIM